MIVSVLSAASLAVVLSPGAAWAHSPFSDLSAQRQSPAEGSTSPVTPAVLVLPAPGAERILSTDVRRVGSSYSIPDARPSEVSRNSVSVFPPSLPSGTYHVRWSYVSSGTARHGETFFSVGRPSHQVDLVEKARPSSSLPHLLAGFMLVGFAYLPPVRLRYLAALPVSYPVASVLLPGAVAHAPVAASLAPAVIVAASFATTRLIPRWRSWPPVVSFAAAAVILPPVSLWSSVASVSLAVSLNAAHSIYAMKESSLSPSSSAQVVLGPIALLVVSWSRFGSDPFSSPTAALAILLPLLLLPACVAVALHRSRSDSPARWMYVPAAALLLASLFFSVYTSSPSARPVEMTASAPSVCLAERSALDIKRCLDAAYAEKTYEGGVVEALQDLSALVSRVPQARFHCHSAAHAIGRAAYFVEGSVEGAFAAGFDVCDFGFFHGIVEASAFELTNEAFASSVAEACLPLLERNELMFMQCKHGLGHAASRRSNGDMVAALGFCDVLRGSPMPERLRESALNACGTGVSMEWFDLAAILPDPSTVLTPYVSSPREVCFEVPEAWQQDCFEYAGNTLDSSRPLESLMELASWCSSTPHPSACGVGLARSAAGMALEPRSVLDVCSSIASGQVRDECFGYFLLTSVISVHFELGWLDRVCLTLPREFDSGPGSVCEVARLRSEDFLSQAGTRLGR